MTEIALAKGINVMQLKKSNYVLKCNICGKTYEKLWTF